MMNSSSIDRSTRSHLFFPSIDADGVVPIVRVARDNVSLCRALLTELTQPAVQ